MSRLRMFAVVLLVSIPGLSFTQPQADAALDKIRTAFVAAYDAEDAAKVASFYAADGSLLAPVGPVVKGRAAIEAYYAKGFEAESFSLTLTPIESATSGTVGFAAGTFRMQAKDKKQSPLTGKFVWVFKRVGSDWRISYDINTVDPPPAPAVKN